MSFLLMHSAGLLLFWFVCFSFNEVDQDLFTVKLQNSKENDCHFFFPPNINFR